MPPPEKSTSPHLPPLPLPPLRVGTDPAQGAALARALLSRLSQPSAAGLVVATSHFGELKALAESSPRFMPAAVEFDAATLRPTYRLLWGSVGQSR